MNPKLKQVSIPFSEYKPAQGNFIVTFWFKEERFVIVTKSLAEAFDAAMSVRREQGTSFIVCAKETTAGHELLGTNDFAEALRGKYGHWEEHPKLSAASWRYEVANESTRRGYWEWVADSLAKYIDDNSSTEGTQET